MSAADKVTGLAETLREHRPLMLGCEAIGLLHMTGKANAKFLKDRNNFKEWTNDLSQPLPQIFSWLDPILNNIYSIRWKPSVTFPHFNKLISGFFNDFDEGKSRKNLIGFLQAGHAMASGIEKNLPKNASAYLNQTSPHIWLSTAFGHPQRNLLAGPLPPLTDQGWQELIGRIEEFLRELKNLGDAPVEQNVERWWKWREDAVGEQGWLRQYFSSTLAETRVPNNDVTLWDQSYVAAALFKSAVAGAVLEGPKFDWTKSLKSETKWRLLVVGMGAEHYQARAVRIGDWTGARMALENFCKRVRRLVEVDLALGSLLYRDASVLVFSFPDFTEADVSKKDWEQFLQREIDQLAREAKFETPPYCHLSDRSRSLVPMAGHIRQAHQKLQMPLHRQWDVPPGPRSNERNEAVHVCPVCLVRPAEKGDKQRPCRVCSSRRRHHRLKPWLKGRMGRDTIWISEVADANDRVALLTLSLDLMPWLDGSRLDSLRAQAIVEWRKHNSVLETKGVDPQENPIDPDDSFASLLKYTKESLEQPQDKKNPVFNSLQDGYRYENGWKEFFEKIVEDRTEAPKWDELDTDGRARWLVHQLFRKLPSPGRIYRFQRQAQEFFQELLECFRKLASSHTNPWRTRRLTLQSRNREKFKTRQKYVTRLDGTPFELLAIAEGCDAETNRLVTVCNLARLLAASNQARDLQEKLEKQPLNLREEEKRFGANYVEADLRLAPDQNPREHLEDYCPIIPLELSPVRFRVLVPLEVASACVDAAVKAWQEQFARVRDRLPLRLGVVAFRRMTPFQSVIEAARALEAELEANPAAEWWWVKQQETRQGVTSLHLRGPKGQDELWTLPVELPDQRRDWFYPYLKTAGRRLRHSHDFQHPDDGTLYRHVCELEAGEAVYIHPSRLAVLFLDHPARRFDQLRPWSPGQWRRMRALWHLLAEQAPSVRALRATWGELLRQREQWQDPRGGWLPGGEEAWLGLVRARLGTALDLRGARLEAVVAAAREGLLAWCLEWHLNVLKLKPGEEA